MRSASPLFARSWLSLGLALSVLLGSAPLSAQPVTVDLPPVKDNTLFETLAGHLSNGAGAFLFAGRNGNGENRRAVLAFDVAGAGIPAGATITQVTLTLDMSRTTSGNQTLALHRLTSDWGEGTSDAVGNLGNEGMGAASTTGDATWIHTFFSAGSWSSIGGDFAPVASASTTVGALGSYQWSSAQMISDVEDWLTTGNAFGWILIGNESQARTSKRFGSRQNSTPAARPVLSITYDPSLVFSDGFESGNTSAWSSTVP